MQSSSQGSSEGETDDQKCNFGCIIDSRVEDYQIPFHTATTIPETSQWDFTDVAVVLCVNRWRN